MRSTDNPLIYILVFLYVHILMLFNLVLPNCGTIWLGQRDLSAHVFRGRIQQDAQKKYYQN